MHTDLMGRKRNPEDAVRGARLRLARKAAGYDSAAEAAESMDPPVEIPTYQAHENGWRSFDRQAARKYAHFLQVNVDWLDENIGPMKGGKGSKSIVHDPLAGLSPENLAMIHHLIDQLKSKQEG